MKKIILVMVFICSVSMSYSEVHRVLLCNREQIFTGPPHVHSDGPAQGHEVNEDFTQVDVACAYQDATCASAGWDFEDGFYVDVFYPGIYVPKPMPEESPHINIIQVYWDETLKCYAIRDI